MKSKFNFTSQSVGLKCIVIFVIVIIVIIIIVIIVTVIVIIIDQDYSNPITLKRVHV